MTADQRLDQLEPLVSQTLAVADRHTAQLKQIYGAVNQLLEVGQIQSDNTQFVLREIDALRQEVRADLDELKHKTNGIQLNQSLTSTRIGDLENAVSLMGNQVPGLDAKVTGLDAKMDQLLGLLSGNKQQ
jgi:hypothetical protein